MQVSEETNVKGLTIRVLSDYGKTKVYKGYKIENGKYVVPLYWAIDNNVKIAPSFKTTRISIPTPDIRLRPKQLECFESCKKEFDKEYGGGIINLSTGSGKTILSLYMIGKYKLKTLIIVNTVELMNQWIQQIKTYFPNTTIGKIQGNVFEKDCNIAIGMLKTISMRKEYTKELFSEYSLIFLDEVHHMSSEVFSEALFKIRNKYVFGLTATVNRKDGLEYVFKWHIGEVLYSDSNGRKQKTKIIKIDYAEGNSKNETLYNGKPNVSSMLTSLANDDNRTIMIANRLKSMDNERRILVLSDRISQLLKLQKLLGDKVSGLFTGKTLKEVKEETKNKKIMLATYQIASEGFDHPCLNTLLFATPRSNIVQSVGRIFRKHHDIQPIIIDIVDNFSIFPYQYKKRSLIYKEQFDIITNVESDDSMCLFT